MLQNIPTLDEIANRSRADAKSQLPALDPYNQSGTVNAELVANAGRVKEIYDQVEIISDNNFLATADEPTLISKGSEVDLPLNPATNASGIAIFTGVNATNIPIATEIQSSEGSTYKTEISSTISNKNLTIDVLTATGTSATATINNGHDLGSGIQVLISGAVETEYNGTFEITVISATVFNYTLLSTATSSPATGTLNANFTTANVNIISESEGQNQNLIGGSRLTLVQTTAGIDQSIKTTILGIDGGTDIESVEEYRARLLFNQRNPSTPFNEANIIVQSQKVSGVTRTFVYEAQDLPRTVSVSSAVATSDFVTLDLTENHDIKDGQQFTITGANQADFNGTFGVVVIDADTVGYYSSGTANQTATGTIQADFAVVQLGQVAVYFVRDNDTPIIPSGQEVQDVKDSLLLIKPADLSDLDLLVRAPNEVTQAFNFSELTPDTIGIRNSIEANLGTLFEDNQLGQDITETQYNTAIQTSFDPETNQVVQTFTIDVSGNLIAQYNEILTLGTVSHL
jgi:uncharacterized phage protein gp47/JayE